MSAILFVPVLAILVASGSLVRLRQSYVTQTHILQHFATVSHFSSLRLAGCMLYTSLSVVSGSRVEAEMSHIRTVVVCSRIGSRMARMTVLVVGLDQQVLPQVDPGINISSYIPVTTSLSAAFFCGQAFRHPSSASSSRGSDLRTVAP